MFVVIIFIFYDATASGSQIAPYIPLPPSPPLSLQPPCGSRKQYRMRPSRLTRLDATSLDVILGLCKWFKHMKLKKLHRTCIECTRISTPCVLFYPLHGLTDLLWFTTN
ncbi:hypothetical protein K439DRAFT_612315 [Ramaria rubella]|nr:hypothetical protein K439DRAFT_612315 [Ramaria rubella]